MQDKLIKIFQKAKYESDQDLASAVWLAIVKHEKRQTRFRLWIFSLVGFVSLAGLAPAFKILGSDLTQSGFYEYFSLIFSDGRSILSAWREFIFSLAESLPMLSIILTLSLIFILFLSLRYIMKQIDRSQLLLPT